MLSVSSGFASQWPCCADNLRFNNIWDLYFCSVFTIFPSQDLNKPPFSVPLVPWLPASSVLINILLTTKLSWQTWIRFSVWMAAGFLVYGVYGWRNSSEEYKMKGLKPPENDNKSESKGSLKMTKYDQDRNSNYFDDFN